ncbi:hypothetical protein Aph01nite_81190 [Acrocarpospora phusangensis]|uniref:HTH cro/C1-type domain-containing protein n=1 Tax=Acrocarpospora phusangensis TaxID=1070424 RepID=A0A919UQI3_9ACTN|nr:hypothetical protein Aph01nite_81190 [Acrocarpospora phusangensis]
MRDRRIAVGLKQAALATLADLSEAQMSKIETGFASASVDSLHRLAKALECDVAKLTAKPRRRNATRRS